MACLNVLVLVAALVAFSESKDLRIGAFNIQIFGTTKASNPEVMEILTKIIRRYDILFIQEIRDSTDTAVNSLLKSVNRGQPAKLRYDVLLSPRLGRTTSKEQYAYFYRKGSGLSVINNYTFMDRADSFEREPYIVAFKSSDTVLKQFTLAGIHVDPDKAVDEINAMYDVVADAKSKLKINDVMLMGDMNADCSYVNRNKWAEIPIKTDSKYVWLIGDDVDTTITPGTNCAYDRFIAHGNGWKSGIVPGSAKVYKFNEDRSLPSISILQALTVSDHYPIEFQLSSRK